ncbi:IS66 family transposase [Mesorhizobium sp. B283B1A]|uniref:IS66 family transposase n=1 Tax=Mesorhizobium TaxID=68287 RepID=UPI00398CFEC7
MIICRSTGRPKSTPARGIQLDRATLGNWAGRACFDLKPIAEHMRRRLADADRLFIDAMRAMTG